MNTETRKILEAAAKLAGVAVSDLQGFKSPPGFACFLNHSDGIIFLDSRNSDGLRIGNEDELFFCDLSVIGMSKGEAAAKLSKRKKRFLRS